MSRLATSATRPQTTLAANAGQGSVAARLGALHRSSGALTHDFNNLLGVIVSANERLVSELPQASEERKLALLALEAAERGAELLRRSLGLGREPQAEPDTVDCTSAIQ